MQDRLARRLAEIVGERAPRSGFPRPTLLPLREGCAIIKDVEITIDVTVSPKVAQAMLQAMVVARQRNEPEVELDGPLKFVTKIEEAAHGHGEDRLAVVRLGDRTIFVVADGTGGVVAGSAAAEAVCNAVVEQCQRGVPPRWAEWLKQLDREMPRAGLVAAVIVEIFHDGRVIGASAGDCEAWLFSEGIARELTAEQNRRPLLGEGNAKPVAFSTIAESGVVLVATDGLWKYASRILIIEAAPRRPLEEAADALLGSARLKSGVLQDDVALAICEFGGS